MGLFDRPKNYRIRSRDTADSYEERFQRLVKITNIVIDTYHNPLLTELSKKTKKTLNQELDLIKENFEYCRKSVVANQQDLNELAKQLRKFIFRVFALYKKEFACVKEKSETEFVIEIDELASATYTYDAENWMIEINGEDLWYLGR